MAFCNKVVSKQSYDCQTFVPHGFQIEMGLREDFCFALVYRLTTEEEALKAKEPPTAVKVEEGKKPKPDKKEG